MKFNISFVSDYHEDIKNCIDFIDNCPKDEKYFLRWFLPENFQYILDNSFSKKERNKIIKLYTKHIYSLKEKEIYDGVTKTKREWSKIEQTYINLIKKIFNIEQVPVWHVKAFATIFLCYPRNISKKYFYFPFQKSSTSPTYVIAHEIMHFVFFEYIKKYYNLNENSRIAGKDPRYIWQVSEVFNNVIENWKPYNKIFNKKSEPYPGTEQMYKIMKKQWGKEQNIKTVLDQWFVKS